MRAQMGFLTCTFALLCVASALSIAEKNDVGICEQVLEWTTCNELRAIAKELHIQAGVVEKLVQDAIDHGVTSAKEILVFVRGRFVDMATSVHCDTFIPAFICSNLEALAKKVHITKDMIDRLVRRLIATGVNTVADIIKAIMKFITGNGLAVPTEECKDESSMEICQRGKDYGFCKKDSEMREVMKNMCRKTCGFCTPQQLQGIMKVGDLCKKFLSKKTCEDLIGVAKKLKVDITEIDTIVKELTEAGITDATRIVRIVREKLVDMAVNFTCKSILPEKVCKKLKELAAIFKVKASEIDKWIRDLVVHGITKIHELIKKIIDRLFPWCLQSQGSANAMTKCERKTLLDEILLY